MSELHLDSPSAVSGNVPLITVGLPVYNRPNGLSKVLDSLAKQTCRNLEIIISDNCSDNPAVAEVIRQAAATDLRIKAYRQKENIGLEPNFNFVYAQSTAPYFMWMSDDDYFDDNYIEACLKVLEEDPETVLCSGQAIYYKGGQYDFTEDMMPLCQAKPFKRVSRYFSRMQQNGKFYGVFRNKLLADEPLGTHIGCDWSFMAKMAVLGKVTFTPAAKYHRAIGGNSATRKRLVRRYGYTGFKNIFLETYSAFVISKNIFSDAAVRKHMGFVRRNMLLGLVFVKIHWLHLLNSIRTRLRRLRKK